MTRTKHAQFAKDLLSGLLETVGIPSKAVEVTSEVREIDLLFVPLPEKAAEREKLGLLGRIAATACLIEPYRNAPGNEDILNCIMHLVIQRGERQRKANREKQTLNADDYEMLWVVGPTISQAVLAAFGAQPAEGWGSGVYFAVSGLRTFLIAAHQLAPTRDTLWLRILGKGKIQKPQGANYVSQAIDEVLALPIDDPLRNLALKLINQWRIRVEQSQDLSPEEQEQLMNFSPAYIAWEEQTLQKGRQEGELRGRELGRQEAEHRILLKQMTRKFGSLDTKVVSQIQAIDNTEKLEQLAEALIDAPDLQTFLQNL
jgi:Domain of unknown function (DUF4351)